VLETYGYEGDLVRAWLNDLIFTLPKFFRELNGTEEEWVVEYSLKVHFHLVMLHSAFKGGAGRREKVIGVKSANSIVQETIRRATVLDLLLGEGSNHWLLTEDERIIENSVVGIITMNKKTRRLLEKDGMWTHGAEEFISNEEGKLRLTLPICEWTNTITEGSDGPRFNISLGLQTVTAAGTTIPQVNQRFLGLSPANCFPIYDFGETQGRALKVSGRRIFVTLNYEQLDTQLAFPYRVRNYEQLATLRSAFHVLSTVTNNYSSQVKEGMAARAGPIVVPLFGEKGAVYVNERRIENDWLQPLRHLVNPRLKHRGLSTALLPRIKSATFTNWVYGYDGVPGCSWNWIDVTSGEKFLETEGFSFIS
jgi:hypothetical protein